MNALSTISGQLSKAFVLGTLVPTVIHAALFFGLVLPLVPGQGINLGQLSLGDALGLIPIGLVVLTISGVLFNLNIPIIQLYEGYSREQSRIGLIRKRAHVDHLQRLQVAERQLRALMGTKGLPQHVEADVIDKWAAILRKLSFEYPQDASQVLPTRLGNTIRAFEQYPNQRYSIESIVLWPRLVAKIDKDYAVVIADAKTSLDFMLNSSLLSTLMFISLLVVGLSYSTVTISWNTFIPWLVELAVFALAVYVFYIGGIDAAGGWGEVVKAAFDLYRLDLLKQLGYSRLPRSLDEERPLWYALSQQLQYGQAVGAPAESWYAPRSTFARGDPESVDLQLTRGVEVLRANVIRIVVAAYNGSEETVRDVVVTDALSDGLEYRWNSARAHNTHATLAVHVEGLNPYRFLLYGDLQPNGTAVLMYEAIVHRE